MEFDYKKEPGRIRKRKTVKESIAPKVSIITPYFNAGKYFEQTFRCVVNQTFPWFEWIIVDDGSTDGLSIEALNKIAGMDSRIHIFHKDNGGISTARNLAIKHSVTDIIIPLDADDLIIPSYVETLYFALIYNPECDWSYTNNVGFQNIEYLWNEVFDSDRLKTNNFLVYSAAIKKEAIIEIGGYGEETKHFFEDWHLWLRLLAAGKKPVKCSIYGFWYRRLDSGVLSIVNNDKDIKKLADKLIADAAETVTSLVKAKSYPATAEGMDFRETTGSDWGDGNIFWEEEQGVTNLLFLIPWMEMGGADQFNLNLISLLHNCKVQDNPTKNRYRMGIISTMQGDNVWRQQFEEYVEDIFELPSFLDVEKYITFIDYFIKSRNINVIFLSNSYYGYYALPWIRKNYPDLIIVDYVHMEEWYWRNGGFARNSSAMQFFIDRTFTCNDKTRDTLIRKFGCEENKIKTVYIGTDIEKFVPEKYERGLIRQKYAIENHEVVVLYPCRIHAQKRPFFMLEIAKKVVKQNKNIVFLVVGDGPQLSELKKQAIELERTKNIIFAGKQDDMGNFYKDSDVTLICSIREGLSLTAYESLAMGVPVISADVGGQGELVQANTGILIPMRQDEEADFDTRIFSEEELTDYVEAIIGLADDEELRHKKGENAIKMIREKFTIQKMAENISSHLEQLEDEQYLEKRRDASRELNKLPKYVEDSLLVFQEWIRSQDKLENVWRERCWYAERLNLVLKDRGIKYYWHGFKRRIKRTKFGAWIIAQRG